MSNALNIMWTEISANMHVLGLAGISGAVVKALVSPEKQWARRIIQGVAGAVSAIFLGPLVANLLVGFVSHEVYAWLAAGFLCGYSGEAVVSIIQNRIKKG